MTNLYRTFFRRSNPFDFKREESSIDALKNKLHLSLNTDAQDHDQYSKDRSPSSVKDVKDMILAGSKSILGKVLSPTKEKYAAREKVTRLKAVKNLMLTSNFLIVQSKSPPRVGQMNQPQPAQQQRPVLMTRRQLTDPFGSDDEEEIQVIQDKSSQSISIGRSQSSNRDNVSMK